MLLVVALITAFVIYCVVEAYQIEKLRREIIERGRELENKLDNMDIKKRPRLQQQKMKVNIVSVPRTADLRLLQKRMIPPAAAL
ncbi:MAG: hypothetical protein LBS00_07685 [Synergistaceae bacterium]|nr:hypothetical protein [Synergistaceae bacterium]